MPAAIPVGPICRSVFEPAYRLLRRVAWVFFWLALSGSLCSRAVAQVNIEARRSMEAGTQFSMDVDFRLSRGNSELYDVGGSGRMDYRSGETYVLGLASVRYGENNGTTYRNRSFVHARLTHYFSAALGAEGFGQIERDGFTLLNLRSLVGAGLRLASVRSEDFSVYHGTAFMVENERLDTERVTVHPDRSTVLRWSNYLSLSGSISDTARLVVIGYIQPRVDRFADTRILSDARLEVTITKSVSLTTAVHLRYDSRPPDAVETYDLSVSNGFRVKL